MRQEVAHAGRHRRGLRQPLPDLGVGEAGARVHHRGIEAVLADLALGGDFHLADHAQPVDVGLERAELVGQRLRQHRYHAPREVDRRPALARVAVERVAVADVVRDVGDGDQQPVAAALALAVDGVVEVARGLAVDGDQRQRGQVDAVAAVRVADFARQLAGGLARGERELVRQVVLAQRDLDLHPRVGVAAQHLDDAGDGLALRRRLLDDLDDDDVAGLRLAAVAGGHQQVLVDAPVLGDDEADAVLLVQPADDAAVGALQHVDDLALGAAAAVDAGPAHRRAVAVQRLVQLARAEEDVGAAVLGNEEAVAVRMALDDAGDEVELGDDAELALAVDQQLAVALHRGEAPVERLEGAPVDGEVAGEVLRRQRYPRLLQRLEDRHAGGQQPGVDVAAPARAALAGLGGFARRGRRCRRGLAARGALHRSSGCGRCLGGAAGGNGGRGLL